MNIELKSKIINDKYTQYVYDSFDIQNKDETIVSIPVNLGDAKKFEWNIGVIYGGSGSGKTTILKTLGDIKTPNFDYDKPLISNFDWIEPNEASLILTSIGLSSVPTWLRPFRLLSNGEQYRAMLAYLVAKADKDEVILVDEYTSVVDRDVARAMSFALQKYIRREKKRIILCSCHFDIMTWLMPDWIYSPQKEGALERCDYLRRGRPQIELQISRVESKAWNFFKKHHYLTEEVNDSCVFLLFEWNDKPVAICAAINRPFNRNPNSMSLSRTVVLPDYQGVGIGSAISDFVCAIIVCGGYRVFTKTVNPALGEYRNNSSNWRKTSKNMLYRIDIVGRETKYRNRIKRSSYCHEYIGAPIQGYEELLLPVDKMRYNKMIEKQFILF